MRLSHVDIWDYVILNEPGEGPETTYPLIGLFSGGDDDKVCVFSSIPGKPFLEANFIHDPGFHMVDHSLSIEKAFDDMKQSPIYKLLSYDPRFGMDQASLIPDMIFNVRDAIDGGRFQFESQDLKFDGVAASRGILTQVHHFWAKNGQKWPVFRVFIFSTI